MLGKLKFYSASEFKINNYFGSPNDYQTVLYIDFEFGRPTFEIFNEVDQQSDNTNVKTFEAVTETIRFDVVYNMPMLPMLYAIPLHDIVELEIIQTGETFTLENLTISDEGGQGDRLAKQIITAELNVYSASAGCSDEGYIKTAC